MGVKDSDTVGRGNTAEEIAEKMTLVTSILRIAFTLVPFKQ